ncbi:MAG: hypothetical protein EOQ98_14840 [Mesorhizobium sp.]|uniref:hypothetical protein n=1 Tax=unclassified Mesorhizobium TaxID=325217 RepID=UPI000FE9BA1D|nr:hypothetical protein [Mesorhizobium sp.]RWO98935.1 MAG: hypothetical protein EOQ98_14840 [Mesorhizobium sp.]RWQ66632.1 MAG: hypothetical protein EOS86_09450 [Mesorhizobium sp.]
MAAIKQIKGGAASLRPASETSRQRRLRFQQGHLSKTETGILSGLGKASVERIVFRSSSPLSMPRV